MKTFTKLVLVVLIVLVSQTVFGQWINTNCPISNVAGIVANNSIIIAGASAGQYYRSTNFGVNWVTNGISGYYNCSASYNNDIFLGFGKIASSGGGLYRSTNDGLNWSLIGFTNTSIYAIEVTSTNIYTITDSGFYKSTNLGSSWTQIPLNPYGYSLTASGSNVFSGGTGIVYRSTNNGVNWTSFSTGLPPNKLIRSMTVSGSYIFAGIQDSGVYRSTNNGQSWNYVGLSGGWWYPFKVSGYNLFTATASGIYLSTNFGDTWIQKNQGIGAGSVKSFAILGDYIFANYLSTIWKRFLLEIISVKKISSEIPSTYSLSQTIPTHLIRRQISNIRL